MFGKTVFDVPGEDFETELAHARATRPASRTDAELSAAQLQELVHAYKKVFHAHTGRDFPQAPHEQLFLAIASVFRSWNAERAVLYRRQERIPHDLGTAVNVMAMVFGNLGDRTPAPAWRSPATRRPAGAASTATTCANAQGEDVVAGIRNTVPSAASSRRIDPASHRELLSIMQRLEQRYRDLCDIEFTIENGKLWMLQTRVGKRTPAAAFVIAAQLVDEGIITLDEALQRVTGEQLAQLMFPSFDTAAAPAAADHRRARLARARPSARSSSTPRPRRRGDRAGDPGPPGDQPGRPARHDRRPGHPDQPRRQDLTRRRGRPRHGQDLRLRRRGTRRSTSDTVTVAGTVPARRRRDLHRRHHRPGLRRRGAGAARRRWCGTSRAS